MTKPKRTRITVTELRDKLPELLSRVAFANEEFVVVKSKKEIALITQVKST
jgi:antitoxin (DNA-binding transcriptional repressor) of toxin-antitoxin stability system